jgi:hypothetical protein
MRAYCDTKLSERGLSDDLPYVGIGELASLGGGPECIAGLKEQRVPAL